jgi:hypothetical protein
MFRAMQIRLKGMVCGIGRDFDSQKGRFAGHKTRSILHEPIVVLQSPARQCEYGITTRKKRFIGESAIKTSSSGSSQQSCRIFHEVIRVMPAPACQMEISDSMSTQFLSIQLLGGGGFEHRDIRAGQRGNLEQHLPSNRGALCFSGPQKKLCERAELLPPRRQASNSAIAKFGRKLLSIAPHSLSNELPKTRWSDGLIRRILS